MKSLVVALLGLVLLSGCTGEVTRRWTEEVALEDGKVITIKRFVRFTESNSLAGDVYSSTDLESRITFTGELASLPDWREVLVPLVVYRDVATGGWVVVATTNRCEVWRARGRPVPGYWEFRLSNGAWVENAISPVTVGRKTNMFFNYEPDLPGRSISIRMKEEQIKTHDFAQRYLGVTGDITSKCR